MSFFSCFFSDLHITWSIFWQNETFLSFVPHSELSSHELELELELEHSLHFTFLFAQHRLHAQKHHQIFNRPFLQTLTRYRMPSNQPLSSRSQLGSNAKTRSIRPNCRTSVCATAAVGSWSRSEFFSRVSSLGLDWHSTPARQCRHARCNWQLRSL
jgi:hypothetical protein